MLATRSLLFNALFYLNMVVLMIIGLPTMLFGRQAVFALARLWGAISVWLLETICGLRLEYRGVENIPPGAVLIAAKHQSFLETFALLKYAPDFAIILKRQLTYVPLFGLYLIVSTANRHRSRAGQAGAAADRRRRQARARRGAAGVHLPGGNAPSSRRAAEIQARRHRALRCDGSALPAGRRQHGPVLAAARLPAPAGPGGDRISAGHRAGAGARRHSANACRSTIESACDRLNAEAIAKDPSLAAVLAEGANSDAETLRPS